MRAQPSPFRMIAVLALLSAGCVRQQDTLEALTAAGAPIPAEALLPLMAAHQVPGVSIAVIRDGVIDWAKGYGVLEAQRPARVDTQTLFQAASISKPVSAVVALRLVGEGRLDLDEDVNRKLVSWNVPQNRCTEKRPVTLRGLLSHSAGLPMHGVPEFEAGRPLPTLVQILNGTWPGATDSVRPVYEPGTMFRYSGGGYIVLQVLLTDITGRPFEALAEELVLHPAGMVSSTYAQPLPPELHRQAAVGHLATGTPLRGSWHTLPEQAAGGLWTTPRDLAAFMIALWQAYDGGSDTFLARDLAREMLTRQIDEFGLGVSLPRAGVFRFQHSGGNAGYRCFMVLSIDNPDGVVIMTNSDAGEPLIWKIFDAIAHAYGWIA